MKGTTKKGKEQAKIEEEQAKKVSNDTKMQVQVNADPNDGPLDGASAVVNMVKTIFPTDEQGKIEQHQMSAKIMASYELGVCSITAQEDNVMFTVRLDEIMQVLFTSAGAYKKMKENVDKPDDIKKES